MEKLNFNQIKMIYFAVLLDGHQIEVNEGMIQVIVKVNTKDAKEKLKYIISKNGYYRSPKYYETPK